MNTIKPSKRAFAFKQKKMIFYLFTLLMTQPSWATNFTTSISDDTTSPVISNLRLTNVNGDKAVVQWDTNEAAVSGLKYNKVGSTDINVRADLIFKKQHSITLTKLITGSSYSITVSATDPSGNTATSSITLGTSSTVNQPPTLSGIPSSNATQNSAYAFSPLASDLENGTLTFSIVNKPSWASFSSINGALTGTPGSSHVGTYSNIMISVSDGITTTDLSPFSITVSAEATNQSANILNFVTTAASSSGSLISNTVHRTPTSTVNSTTSGMSILSNISGISHEITLNNDGSTSSTLTSLGVSGTNQESKIESDFVGTITKILDAGGIEFEAAITNQCTVKNILNKDGTISHEIHFTRSNGSSDKSVINAKKTNSNIKVNATGGTQLESKFDSAFVKSSGTSVNVHNEITIATTTDGTVTIHLDQNSSDAEINSKLNKLIKTGTYQPGTEVLLENQVIKLLKVRNTEVQF